MQLSSRDPLGKSKRQQTDSRLILPRLPPAVTAVTSRLFFYGRNDKRHVPDNSRGLPGDELRAQVNCNKVGRLHLEDLPLNIKSLKVKIAVVTD